MRPQSFLRGYCAVAVATAAAGAGGGGGGDFGATALGHTPPLPFYTGPQPDITEPLAGFHKVREEFNAGAFFGSEKDGRYNHAAMWHYHDNLFTLSWKNAPETEDTPGQRVLCVRHPHCLCCQPSPPARSALC